MSEDKARLTVLSTCAASEVKTMSSYDIIRRKKIGLFQGDVILLLPSNE